MERIPHCILHPLARRILGFILRFYDTQKRFSNQRYSVGSLLSSVKIIFLLSARMIIHSIDQSRRDWASIFLNFKKIITILRVSLRRVLHRFPIRFTQRVLSFKAKSQKKGFVQKHFFQILKREANFTKTIYAMNHIKLKKRMRISEQLTVSRESFLAKAKTRIFLSNKV